LKLKITWEGFSFAFKISRLKRKLLEKKSGKKIIILMITRQDISPAQNGKKYDIQKNKIIRSAYKNIVCP